MLGLFAGRATAADPVIPPPQTFITKHKTTINGAAIKYTATAGETYLTNLGGEPIGSIFSFAYVKDGPVDTSRPVLFVFNGGPGSASVWLHMGAVGPKRVVLDNGVNPSNVPPFGLEANPDSVLDVADIVFIDPVGTGFSRVIGKGKPEDFFGVDEDANAVAQFIELWLTRNGRWNSPKFVMGESYGSVRAAVLPRALMGGPFYVGVMRGIQLNGIILLGTTLNMRPQGQPDADAQLWTAALRLPGYAATAWYHGKVGRQGRTLEALFEEARQFALTDYIAALRTPPTGAAREALIGRLAAYTGLPAAAFEKDLRVSDPVFAKDLLADKNLSVGMYDSRYTLPTTPTGSDPVADDPGMGQYVPGFIAAFHEMLGRDLNVAMDRPYGSIVWRDLLSKWKWERAGALPNITPKDYAEDLAIAMRRNPKLRLFVAGGYYDLVTTAAAAQKSVEDAQIPKDRLTLKNYASGHMLYVGDTAKAFSEDVRTLIRSAR